MTANFCFKCVDKSDIQRSFSKFRYIFWELLNFGFWYTDINNLVFLNFHVVTGFYLLIFLIHEFYDILSSISHVESSLYVDKINEILKNNDDASIFIFALLFFLSISNQPHGSNRQLYFWKCSNQLTFIDRHIHELNILFAQNGVQKAVASVIHLSWIRLWTNKSSKEKKREEKS